MENHRRSGNGFPATARRGPARTLAAGFLAVTLLLLAFPTAGVAAEWTWMVYLDGDNDLEFDAIGDFLEMAQVGSNEDVRVVVQMDRMDGFDDRYGNWTSCKRFLVTPGMTPTAANALQDLGEANMGDPETLTAFIDWAVANHPADRYALVLWDHGDGWRTRAASSRPRKSLCVDLSNNGDALYTREVGQALAATTVAVDLVGFDACLMGMIEVAYEIRDSGAAVMVGSEQTEPGDGWPYDTILGELTSFPFWTPADLGAAIVNRYYQSYGNGETQSAVDLARIEPLAVAVSDLADTLIRLWDTDRPAVLTAAQGVMSALDAAVIEERHGRQYPGARGLAVYFPSRAQSLDGDYNGGVIDFPGDTWWDEFIAAFHTSMQGSWVEAARSRTQSFYIPEHLDIRHFCEKLSDPSAADPWGPAEAEAGQPGGRGAEASRACNHLLALLTPLALMALLRLARSRKRGPAR